MRRLTHLSLIVTLCVAFAGCRPAPPPQRVHPDVLAAAGLQYYWSLSLVLDKKETVLRVHRLDENVYCLTSNYRLIAVDAARGLMRWSYQVADPGQTVFDPIHVDGIRLTPNPIGIEGILDPATVGETEPFDAVLINTLSHVLVLDRATGELYRKIPFDFAANTTGVSDGKYFYVGSTEGLLYAILLNEAIPAWTLSANDMITAPIAMNDGKVFMVDESGGLFAVRPGEQGRKLWSQNLGGAVTAAMYVDPRGCFVPSDDNRLYAFDVDNGERLWERPFVCQRPLRDAVQASDNTLFQLADPQMFHAINVVDGKQRWSRQDGRLVVGALGGEIYLLNRDNAMLIVDEMLGTVRTSLPMAGWELFMPNATNSAVYVANRRGDVACIREQAAGRLTTDMLRK